MKIDFTEFKGIMPRYAPKMLPDNFATTANNLELLGGKILPLSGITLPQDNLGIYRVKGPIVDDQHDRYYKTDGTGPLLVEGGALATAKFPIPTAPTGVRVKGFTNIINSGIKGFIRPYSGNEVEMTLLEIVAGVDDDSKKVRFRYDGEASANPFSSVFVNPYLQLHIDSEKFLPDAFSVSPADGTNLDILSINNEVIGKYYIESVNVYNIFPTANPGGLPNTLSGKDIEFVIRNKYIDTIKENYYLYRYVDSLGVEGPPSALSALITRYPGETITLNIPAAVTGMSYVRIYRSAGVAQAAGFYFVADVALGAGTYSDNVDNADLSEIMPNYGNPPDGMDNLVLLSGGFMAATKGKDIYFCDPYLPHTWSYSNAVNVDDNIVATASRRNTLLVMTDVKLHMFSGNDPESMLPVELAFNQPCLAQQGVSKIDGDVFYPSDDGLCMVSNAGFSIVTKNSFRKEDWLALKPDTFIAGEYNNKYIAVNEDGLAIIVDIAEGFITTYTDGATAIWQSKVFVIDKITSFSVIRLIAANYPVTVEFFAEGVSVLSLSILDKNPRRIPVLRNEREWQIKITSIYRVDSLVLATSGEEI